MLSQEVVADIEYKVGSLGDIYASELVGAHLSPAADLGPICDLTPDLVTEQYN